MFRESAAEDTSLLVTAFEAKIFGLGRATGAIRSKVVLDESVSNDPVEVAIGNGEGTDTMALGIPGQVRQADDPGRQ